MGVASSSIWEGAVKGVAHAAVKTQVNSLTVRLRNSSFLLTQLIPSYLQEIGPF